jgi:hypothetical protein
VVVIVADGNAAVAIAKIARKPDGILVRRFLPYTTPVRSPANLRIAQHAADRRDGERLEIEGAARSRAFGQEYPVLFVEGDLRDLGRTGRRRHRDFNHCVIAERAVGVQTHRPNLEAIGHRVVQAMLVNGEAENAALRRRIVPGCRIGAIEVRPGDVNRPLRISSHRKQSLRLAPGHPVVVMVKNASVDCKVKDESALAIGDIKRV